MPRGGGPSADPSRFNGIDGRLCLARHRILSPDRVARMAGGPTAGRHPDYGGRTDLHHLRAREHGARSKGPAVEAGGATTGNLGDTWRKGRPNMKDGSAFLNERANTIADGMAHQAERLRITVMKGPLECRLIDAGAKVLGSVEAGMRIAEICMGGLGTVKPTMGTSEKWPFSVEVRASQPVLACLGSQYAGWNLSEGKYFAMGSGPARILAGVEPLFSTLAYRETADRSVVLLEASAPPPVAVVEKVSKATGLSPDKLSFVDAPTQSLAGTVQIVARVLEVALHKANDLKF